MEKDRKVKTVAVAAVLVAIIGLSIAFAALSQTLTINGQGKVASSKWDVVWQEINGEEFNKSAGVGIENGYPKLDNISIVKDNDNVEEGENLNLGNISLKKPGDYASYKINIKNKGDIDATLESINTPDLSLVQVGQSHTADEFITIEVLNGTGSSSITTPQNLAADAIIPVLVKVTFNNIGNELFNEIPSTGIEINNFEITFTVNQATSEIAVEPEEEETDCSPNPPALGANDITIGTEDFYYLGSSNGYKYYLAKYNLQYGDEIVEMDMSTGNTVMGTSSTVIRQGLDSDCHKVRGAVVDMEAQDAASMYKFPWKGLTAFSSSLYYRASSHGNFYTAYDNNAKYPARSFASAGSSGDNYVYDENSSIYNILSSNNVNDDVESYYEYLHGINSNVVEARLMTYEEALALGCSGDSCSSAPSYLTYTTFWLGSAYHNNNSMKTVVSAGSFGDDEYNHVFLYGVRPLIVVAD